MVKLTVENGNIEVLSRREEGVGIIEEIGEGVARLFVSFIAGGMEGGSNPYELKEVVVDVLDVLRNGVDDIVEEAINLVEEYSRGDGGVCS